jgi:hypothetical protein
MSLHINRFIDSVKAHEARGTQQFMMPLRDAKDLHADITKLLLTVNQLRDQLAQAQSNDVITVEVSGQAF